jgi:hypothetical protein
MRAFWKLWRQKGLQNYLRMAVNEENGIRYSHTAKGLPTVVVQHANYAMAAE